MRNATTDELGKQVTLEFQHSGKTALEFAREFPGSFDIQHDGDYVSFHLSYMEDILQVYTWGDEWFTKF